MAGVGVKVHGFTEMQRAFAKADKNVKKEQRKTLKKVAEPVQSDAVTLALSDIPGVGDVWSRFRIGITTRQVYVAPQQRGRGRLRRPNFASLLMDRAMQPALDQNENKIEDEFERMLDEIGRDWGRGG